jgi:hypothetical protein
VAGSIATLFLYKQKEMAKLTNGTRGKNKPARTIIGSKDGQTVVSKGYTMGLVRKKGEPETRTKTIGSGISSMNVTTPVGIYAPIPAAKEKSASSVTSKPKRSGKTSAGKVIDRAKKAMTPDKSTFKIKGRGKGDGPLKCFKYN